MTIDNHARHRAPTKIRRVIKVAPAVAATVAFTVLSATVANAAPSQPGVTSPQGAQPGVTTAPPVAPAPAQQLPPVQQREYIGGYQPSPRVQQTPWRSVDDARSGRAQSSAAPVYYAPSPQQSAPVQGPPSTPSPAPAPVLTVTRTTIAATDVPDGYVLVGKDLVPVDPNLVGPRLLEQLNNTLQGVQADGANFLVDAGYADVPQADRIAAGTAGGATLGAVTGFGISLVPATALTVTGGLIGLGVGATAVPFTWWAPGVGWVFGPGLGAAIGAGAGAAASLPIVALSTVGGGVIGAVLGATAAGGEQRTIIEPAPAPAPEPAPAPLPAPVEETVRTVTAQATATVDQLPGGSEVMDTASDVIAASDWKQQVDTTVADVTAAASTVPGGAGAVTSAAPVVEQAVSVIDAAISAAFPPAG